MKDKLLEHFVVEDFNMTYTSIKGNGFEKLLVLETEEDIQPFVDFVNKLIDIANKYEG